MKRIIKKTGGKFIKLLSKCGLISNKIIIQVDGGICSQIHFYLAGKRLEQLTGCKVEYDLEWYDLYGMDTIGRYVRHFNFELMFPDIKFEKARPGILRWLYIKFCFRHIEYNEHYTPQEVRDLFKGPLYIEGYFGHTEEMMSILKNGSFSINTGLLPKNNLWIKSKIEKASRMGTTCAVHVRRGDLSANHPVYGEAPRAEYFIEAMRRMERREHNVTFFIFSEEPYWFIRNIKSHLKGMKIYVVDVNGSERGWCDLILMSLCRCQITSHGAMGKYAALLRKERHQDGAVMMPPNKNSEEWIKFIDNSEIVEQHGRRFAQCMKTSRRSSKASMAEDIIQEIC